MKATAQIYLNYEGRDQEKVECLYHILYEAGFKPWMAKIDLLPGERWQVSIQNAIRRSDFFLACLSAHSLGEGGWIHKEIEYAMAVSRERPEDDIYLIPVRLEPCEIPEKLQSFWGVDLFEKDDSVKLVQAIVVAMERRANVAAEDEGPSPGTDMATPEGPEGEQLKGSQESLNSKKADPGEDKHINGLGKDYSNEGESMLGHQLSKSSEDSAKRGYIKTIIQGIRDSLFQPQNISKILKSIEKIAGELSGKKDVKDIAASEIELLTHYHKLALYQARRSFNWALFCACVGVISFMLSGAFLLVQPSRDVTVLGVIASALMEVISGIIFYLYNKSSSQLADFHTRLDLTQRFLLANSICEGIDGDLGQQVRSHLALTVAGTDVTLTPPQPPAPSQTLTPSQIDAASLLDFDVHITYIEYNPPGDDVEGEYIRVKNSGGIAADMTNWTLRDKANHEFRFPAFTLKPGKSVRVWTKAGKNTSDNLYWGRNQAVWNNAGDCAYLQDSTKALIDTYCYP